MAFAFATLAVLCFLGPGCGKGPLSPLFVTKDQLLAAPLEIEIDGRAYTLATSLWRDMMPSDDVESSDLAAFVYITAVDGQPFPADVDATYVWVINGDETWATEFSKEYRPPSQSRLYQLGEAVGGGPRWDVGTEVEVVVQVTDKLGKVHLLRATGVKIGAIY